MIKPIDATDRVGLTAVTSPGIIRSTIASLMYEAGIVGTSIAGMCAKRYTGIDLNTGIDNPFEPKKTFQRSRAHGQLALVSF
mgnify:CR=1 FL=1